MSAKFVRNQLIAFFVVTLLGVTYMMVSFVGLPRILGIGQYHVSVNMPAVGGLYANAIVTEQGVTVGKVNDVRLAPGGRGVIADIGINNGTKIPANLHASVANTSAIGEQYLELTPQGYTGPDLAAGSVIPASRVSLPPDPTAVLDDLNTLLRSVPNKQLNITVNELYNAFNGTGPDLGRLLDSSGQLVTAAQQNLAPTKALIGQSQTVLATQAANSANIRAFSRNLNLFTTQLRNSNGDLAGAINRAPGLTGQLNALIGQLQPTLPLLLTNLTSTGQVLRVYLPNLRQTLVMLPAGINDLSSIIQMSPPGSYNAMLQAQQGNPSPCTAGYQTTIRQPTDIGYKAPPAANKIPYCMEPHNSPLDVRGNRNYPCPNNPSLRSATAGGCGLNFGTDSVPGESYSGNTYEPGDGLFVGPDGDPYSVGQPSRAGSGPTTLKGLLQQTLG